HGYLAHRADRTDRAGARRRRLRLLRPAGGRTRIADCRTARRPGARRHHRADRHALVWLAVRRRRHSAVSSTWLLITIEEFPMTRPDPRADLNTPEEEFRSEDLIFYERGRHAGGGLGGMRGRDSERIRGIGSAPFAGVHVCGELRSGAEPQAGTPAFAFQA